MDMEKFAVLAGYSTVVNARKRFGEVKKRVRTLVFGPDGNDNDYKVCADDTSGDNSDGVPKKGPKKAAKAGTKRKAAGVAGNGGRAAKKGKGVNKEQSEKTGMNAVTQHLASVKDGGVNEEDTKEDADNDEEA